MHHSRGFVLYPKHLSTVQTLQGMRMNIREGRREMRSGHPATHSACLLQESGSLKTLLPKQDGKVLQAAYLGPGTWVCFRKNRKDKAMDKNQYNKLEKKALASRHIIYEFPLLVSKTDPESSQSTSSHLYLPVTLIEVVREG